MNIYLTIIGLLITTSLLAQTKDPKDTEIWDPEPRVVEPGINSQAPSDAIILFDGSNLEAWQSTKIKNGKAEWDLVEGNAMQVKPGAGDIMSRQAFGDVQLHLEFRTPAVVESEGQGRGNSGVFLQGRYEVQILDSYQNRTYSNGQAAAVYKQHVPLVNASKAPGEWQTYDIIFKAPSFNTDGINTSPAYLTVLHNGVLVQNHVQIYGAVEHVGLAKYRAHGDDFIKLQDHSNLVQFRNIWVRELK